MKFYAMFLYVLFIQPWLAAFAEAQCSGGSCSTPGRGVAVPRGYYQPQYAQVQQVVRDVPQLQALDFGTPQWQEVPGAKDQIALMQDGRHLGSWNLSGQYYLARVGDGWGPKQFLIPVPLPAKYRQTEVKRMPTVSSEGGECPGNCECGCGVTGRCDCHNVGKAVKR